MTFQSYQSTTAKPTEKPHIHWSAAYGEWVYTFYPHDGLPICDVTPTLCNYLDVMSNPNPRRTKLNS